jgi:transposase-like protein
MEAEQSRKRKRYGRELKAQVLAKCDALGASVAKVAMTHGINANIVHGWRKLGAIRALRGGHHLCLAPSSHRRDDSNERSIEHRKKEARLTRGEVPVKG